MIAASPWLLREPGPRRPFRLFCFAYAGGNAQRFLRWQRELDPAIDVVAVQLPGRGARLAEAPIDHLPTLIKALAPVIARCNDLPFAFFGHSLGGLVAFELARYAKLNYLPMPTQLIVSGCSAPQRRVAVDEPLHALPDDAFIERLRDYNGTPPDVLANRELMRLVLPTLRADFALVETYRYRAGLPLTLPIRVFAGRGDPHCSAEQVAAWRAETLGRCDVRWFDGDHFFLHSAEHAVLDALAAELGEAQCA